MAEAAQTAATPARARRKPQGPRTQKPIFAVVSYQDEQGVQVRLEKSRLNIILERDAAKLVELLAGEGGAGFDNVAVVRVELPQGAPRKPAEAGSGNAS